MKAVLIVLSIIIFLLLLLLFLPITVDFAYENEFVLKIKYSGITFFENQKRKKLKKAKNHKNELKSTTDDRTQKKENFFKKTYKQKGLIGSINYFSEFFILLFKKLWWVIKHFKFRNFSFNLSVATNDAASTAINYGKACSAVYPVIAIVESNADFKAKEINIKADFDNTNPKVQISASVTTRIFFWLVAAVGVLFEFLRLQRKEREKI